VSAEVTSGADEPPPYTAAMYSLRARSPTSSSQAPAETS
jgi:hypothetical protein